jgi:hypothetical protein
MLLGGPQNTIKSHLVFTALFCFAPFSVFSSRMSAPHLVCTLFINGIFNMYLVNDLLDLLIKENDVGGSRSAIA